MGKKTRTKKNQEEEEEPGLYNRDTAAPRLKKG
jgi:hypothetical protein